MHFSQWSCPFKWEKPKEKWLFLYIHLCNCTHTHAPAHPKTHTTHTRTHEQTNTRKTITGSHGSSGDGRETGASFPSIHYPRVTTRGSPTAAAARLKPGLALPPLAPQPSHPVSRSQSVPLGGPTNPAGVCVCVCVCARACNVCVVRWPHLAYQCALL
jgi:hypothetical protein